MRRKRGDVKVFMRTDFSEIELGELSMRHYASRVAFVAALAVAGLTLSACATEGYVDEHIGAVNTRVDSVDGKVNALSGRVDALSSRVDTNDRNAQAAIAANRAALDTKSVA